MMTDVMEVADRAKKKMADAIELVTQDICELDGGVDERDPKRLVLTTDDLDRILRRHLLGEE